MQPIRRLADNALPPLVLATLLLWGPAQLESQTLRGSSASLDRQNAQARAHSFSYLETAERVRQFVAAGYLVPVVGNRDFDVHNVSFPYARPEARLFIERLAAQYRSACGEKLVVTSLTRPRSHQPPNASSRSVHPTGMAIDLRRSANARCRGWLESTLLGLERNGVLEAIYERSPPHYHVALYPQPYAQYLASRVGNQTVVASLEEESASTSVEWVTHRVARGENLTAIARRYGSTVSRVRAENRLAGSRILAGQELRIPVYVDAPAASGTVVAAAESPAAEADVSTAEADVSTAETPGSHALDASDPGPGSSESTATFASSDGGASSGASGPMVHTVARGESLWTISRLYGVSEAQLRSTNGLAGNRILAGQELTIPGALRVATAAVVEHRVNQGDSLWSIARRHGVSVDDIRRQNGIGTRIYAGQVLEIPTDG